MCVVYSICFICDFSQSETVAHSFLKTPHQTYCTSSTAQLVGYPQGMVFQLSRIVLGKWKGWDHIKGQTKAKGSIHIRHILGSRGRYKKWSDHYGMRDGQRSAMNHIKRGLGVKIGGGLFGLRIPRQKALKTMTKEDLEIELNGHPNITNPYRYYLDEHPGLSELTDAPRLRLSMVVAMPQGGNGIGHSARTLPPTWVATQKKIELIVPHLAQACESLNVTFATHRCSIHVTGTSDCMLLSDAIQRLFIQHNRGIPLRLPSAKTSGYNHRSSALFAANFSSSQNTKQVPHLLKSSSGSIARSDVREGLHAVLGAMRIEHPNSLRLCTTINADDMSRPVDAMLGGCATPSSSAADVLKWWEFNHDTRGHFKDSVGHAQRIVDVSLVVEVMTVSPSIRGSVVTKDYEGEISSALLSPNACSIFNVGTRKVMTEHQYNSVVEPLDGVAEIIAHYWKARQATPHPSPSGASSARTGMK